MSVKRTFQIPPRRPSPPDDDYSPPVKKLTIIVLVVAAIALLVTAIDAVSTRMFMAKAKRISVGDTKMTVERSLGHPVALFTRPPEASTNFVAALLSVRAETWAYGRKLNLRHPFLSKFPYFYPFRFRMFSPDSDDVAIEFDASGKVSKISIP
jgi:hypothetical protein